LKGKTSANRGGGGGRFAGNLCPYKQGEKKKKEKNKKIAQRGQGGHRNGRGEGGGGRKNEKHKDLSVPSNKSSWEGLKSFAIGVAAPTKVQTSIFFPTGRPLEFPKNQTGKFRGGGHKQNLGRGLGRFQLITTVSTQIRVRLISLIRGVGHNIKVNGGGSHLPKKVRKPRATLGGGSATSSTLGKKLGLSNGR